MAGIALAGLLVALLWAPLDSTVAEETPQTVAEAEEITAKDAESAEELPVEVTPTRVAAPPAIPVFLSLQQQRAADLAYKMLNTELGQLGVEELKRVQAMKFEGGLRVTDVKVSSRTGNEPNLFRKGDLLVGLHVWPITSLEDVQEVLQREDIEELSPLKSYVIRKTPKPQQLDGGYGGGYGGLSGMGSQVEYEDKLITGRISVNVDALKRRKPSRDNPYQTETTLDEWGEPVKQKNEAAARAKSDLETLEKEIDRRIKELEEELTKTSKQRDLLHEEMMQQEKNGKLEKKTRDAFATYDRRKQKLLRQIQEIKREKQRVERDKQFFEHEKQLALGRQRLWQVEQEKKQLQLANQKLQQAMQQGRKNQQQLAEIERRRAEADLQAAKQTAEFAKQRHEMGELTTEELRKAQSQADQAKLILERAQVQLQAAKQSGNMPARSIPGLSTELQLQLAEIELRSAKTTHEAASQAYTQAKQLHEDGIVSPGEFRKLQHEMKQAALQVEHAQVMLSTFEKQISAAKKQNTTLLYDDKTFDQWRSLWKNELKTEKRTEAIKALAAFGRAGFGKEAAEAILDVAGEYDFSHESSSPPIEVLKSAVYEVLNGVDPIESENWLPELLNRLKAEPKKWSGLYQRVGGYIRNPTPELRSRTIEVANNAKYNTEVRATAIGCIATTDYELRQQETIDLLRVSLTSEQPEFAMAVLGHLHFRHLDELPEQFDSFFHANARVRKSAYRNLMGTGDDQITALVIDRLLAVLKNSDRREDHLSAVRALAWNCSWLGRQIPHKKALISDHLIDILISGDSTLLRDAIIALGRLHSESSSLVIKRVNQVVSPKRQQELKTAVQEADSNPPGDSTISGGGGLGGGGGGGFF